MPNTLDETFDSCLRPTDGADLPDGGAAWGRSHGLREGKHSLRDMVNREDFAVQQAQRVAVPERSARAVGPSDHIWIRGSDGALTKAPRPLSGARAKAVADATVASMRAELDTYTEAPPKRRATINYPSVFVKKWTWVKIS